MITVEKSLAKLRKIIKRIFFKEPTWRQFKVIVTNPPNYQEHFELIKFELIPFVSKYSHAFWITNYHNQNEDFILFRVKCTEKQANRVVKYLSTLRSKSTISAWEISTWNPSSDAQLRIHGLSKLGINPKNTIITSVDLTTKTITTMPHNNLQKREKQLTALFETVGECTKAIYSNLETKPDDPWAMSLFIHLLINSLDFSGPDQPSDEYNIRNIPPF